MTEKTFFSSKKKEKLVELKSDLVSDKKERRKEALKKIINDMTTGNDMGELFPEVVKLLQTDHSETKKLVYLYLTGYARTHPDLAILAVNTFVKDCEDSNPVIRALAVRTMCCVCVSSLVEHLCDPLRKCLRDSDAYVRKTAVLSVLKLFQQDSNVVFEQGFLGNVIEMLMDSNPNVLTNCLAVLTEIFEKHPEKVEALTYDIRLVNKLLGALNECTEWGQIIILDFLVFFSFSSKREALNVAERVTSRLSHANSAVVLSAVKLLLNIVAYIGTDCLSTSKILTKLGPPLITMLSLEPELQYVALRNINLIIQKYPSLLQNDFPSFYVKYNDPLYIKIEKLSILIMLVDESNVDRVLTELKDYSSEVDVDFVRKSVRAIGDCALKIPQAADRCVKTLTDLIDTKISYVVQESIIVTRDIMRKYPLQYENVIQKIGDNLLTLDEPEARAAFIWILGEYGERISESSEFMKMFVEGFLEESSTVQLQLLSAIIKMFLKIPNENRETVEEILSIATQKIENPDIRDRAYMYWRLLSIDPEVARQVVLAKKPTLSYRSRNLDPTLLNNLLPHISTLCSVFHKMPQSLVDSAMLLRSKSVEIPDDQLDSLFTSGKNEIPYSEYSAINNSLGNLIDFPTDSSRVISNSKDIIPQHFSISDVMTEQISSYHNKKNEDHSRSFKLIDYQLIFNPDKTLLFSSQAGKGLEVYGHFITSENNIYLNLFFKSTFQANISQFSLQVNVNYFGLSLCCGTSYPKSLSPTKSENLKIPLIFTGRSSITLPIDLIHVALKINQDVFYFSVYFPLHFYFIEPEEAKIDIEIFNSTWDSLWPTNKCEKILSSSLLNDAIIYKLQELKMYVHSLISDEILANCVLKNNCKGLIKITNNKGSLHISVGSANQEIIEPLVKLILIAISS